MRLLFLIASLLLAAITVAQTQKASGVADCATGRIDSATGQPCLIYGHGFEAALSANLTALASDSGHVKGCYFCKSEVSD